MKHPLFDTLVQYVSDSLCEADAVAVDTHLCDCGECLERIKGLLYLRANFEYLWDTWTAAGHGRLFLKWRILNALIKATESAAIPMGAVLRWLCDFDDFKEIKVEFTIDSVGRLALVEGKTAKADFSCITDDLPGTLEVNFHDRLMLRFIVNQASRKSLLYYWPENENDIPEVSVIYSKNNHDISYVSTFVKTPGEGYYLAEFPEMEIPGGGFKLYIPMNSLAE